MLVLSEFAGAADELIEAVLVNPHDIAGVKSQMPAGPPGGTGRRRQAHAGHARHLYRNDLEHWASSFFDALRDQGTDR